MIFQEGGQKIKRKSLLLSLIILAAVVLSACGGGSPAIPGQEVTVDGGSYRNITPAELSKMLGDEDLLLVNVHIPYTGELAGTDLSVSYLEVEQSISQFPQDKGAKIVLTCLTGPMSVTVAKTLVGLGYTNVFNLKGGMTEWEQQGYQVINIKTEPGSPEAPDTEEDSIIGSIIEVHRGGEEGTVGQILLESSSGTIMFTIKDETQIFEQDGADLLEASFDALHPLDEVEVWFTGPVLESFPAQATAEKIVILYCPA